MTNRKSILRLGNSTKTISHEIPITSKKPTNEAIHIARPDNPCISCKGKNLACGKFRCPIISKLKTYQTYLEEIDRKDLWGASPPGVFVGTFGYPKVAVGPMVPPESGDTTIYDSTENWFGLPQRQILSYRMRLVRGKFEARVDELESSRLLEITREIGLAKGSVETDVSFFKKPHQRIKLDVDVQPMGPSAPLAKINIGSTHTDHQIEKVYSDNNLKAKEAIILLASQGVAQSAITRALSMGLLGSGKLRQLVPTRWSITAVDSTLGLHYWHQVQTLPLINEIRVFESTYLANRFVVLMLPEAWGYELVEAWFPQSAWNPGRNVAVVNDFEGIHGRKTYAKIGGCYYSARNIVGQYLTGERRQARTVILRETYPGQEMPMGVWLVREMVRKALEFPYKTFDTLKEAFDHISGRLLISPRDWINSSGILGHAPEVRQKSLISYLS